MSSLWLVVTGKYMFWLNCIVVNFIMNYLFKNLQGRSLQVNIELLIEFLPQDKILFVGLRLIQSSFQR